MYVLPLSLYCHILENCMVRIAPVILFHENKPTSFAPRLKILFIFADNPTIKIGMGQHHPTIAFVISYLLLAGAD